MKNTIVRSVILFTLSLPVICLSQNYRQGLNKFPMDADINKPFMPNQRMKSELAFKLDTLVTFSVDEGQEISTIKFFPSYC
jgi:hypothetical protein